MSTQHWFIPWVRSLFSAWRVHRSELSGLTQKKHIPLKMLRNKDWRWGKKQKMSKEKLWKSFRKLQNYWSGHFEDHKKRYCMKHTESFPLFELFLEVFCFWHFKLIWSIVNIKVLIDAVSSQRLWGNSQQISSVGVQSEGVLTSSADIVLGNVRNYWLQLSLFMTLIFCERPSQHGRMSGVRLPADGFMVK